MTVAVTAGQVATTFARRAGPVPGLAADADELAAARRAMARRFLRGGRDARVVRGEVHVTAFHVAWELVHVFPETGEEAS